MNRKGESITQECLGRGWERSPLLFQHQLALQPLIDVSYTTAASGPGGRKPLAHPSLEQGQQPDVPSLWGTKVGAGQTNSEPPKGSCPDVGLLCLFWAEGALVLWLVLVSGRVTLGRVVLTHPVLVKAHSCPGKSSPHQRESDGPKFLSCSGRSHRGKL